MPLGPVPFGRTAVPRLRTVPAGTVLWRVTREPAADGSRAATPTPLFWPGYHERTRNRPRLGGRFDPCPDDDYGYCYAALDDLTALAETLLRDVSFDGPGRSLPAEDIRDRRLALLETRRELSLISLVSFEDLAAAWQDTWLLHAEEDQYAMTRCWGHWLRRCAGTADGIVWRSKRNPDGLAVLLFQDRCESAIEPSSLGYRRLDDEAGLDWLKHRLTLVMTYITPENVDDDPEVGAR